MRSGRVPDSPSTPARVAFRRRRVAAQDGPGRAARPGAIEPPRRAAPLAGTPAVARSAWPTCSSRSRTTSGSASTPAAGRETGRPPGRSARCWLRSLPTAATSASTPWRRSPPTSPTGGSSTSAIGRLVEENRAALAAIRPWHLPPRRRRPLGRRHDVGQRRAALRHAAQGAAADLHGLFAGGGEILR